MLTINNISFTRNVYQFAATEQNIQRSEIKLTDDLK